MLAKLSVSTSGVNGAAAFSRGDSSIGEPEVPARQQRRRTYSALLVVEVGVDRQLGLSGGLV